MESEYGRGGRGGRRRRAGSLPDRRGAIEDAVDRRVDREGEPHRWRPTRLMNGERQALAAELGLAFDAGILIDSGDE